MFFRNAMILMIAIFASSSALAGGLTKGTKLVCKSAGVKAVLQIDEDLSEAQTAPHQSNSRLGLLDDDGDFMYFDYAWTNERYTMYTTTTSNRGASMIINFDTDGSLIQATLLFKDFFSTRMFGPEDCQISKQ